MDVPRPTDAELVLQLSELADGAKLRLNNDQLPDMMRLAKEGVALNRRHSLSDSYPQARQDTTNLYSLCSIGCAPTNLLSRALYIRQGVELQTDTDLLLLSVMRFLEEFPLCYKDFVHKTDLAKFVATSLNVLSGLSLDQSGSAFLLTRLCRVMAACLRGTDPSMVSEDIKCSLLYREAYYLKHAYMRNPILVGQAVESYQLAKEAYSYGGCDKAEVALLFAECEQIFVRIRDAKSTHASLSPQNDDAEKQLPCLPDNGITVDPYMKKHQPLLEETKTEAKEQHEKQAAKKQQKKREKSKPLVASDDEDIESAPDDIGEQTPEEGFGAVPKEGLHLLQQAPDDTDQETSEEERGAVANTCSPLLQPKPQVEQSKHKGNTGCRMRSDTASSSSQSRSRSGTPSRRNQDSPPPEKPRPKFPKVGEQGAMDVPRPTEAELVQQLSELADGAKLRLNNDQLKDMMRLAKEGVALNRRHSLSDMHPQAQQDTTDLYAMCSIGCAPTNLLSRALYIRQGVELQTDTEWLLLSIMRFLDEFRWCYKDFVHKTDLAKFVATSLNVLVDLSLDLSGSAFLLTRLCRVMAACLRGSDPSMVSEDIMCSLLYREAYYLKHAYLQNPIAVGHAVESYQLAKEAYSYGGCDKAEVALLFVECEQIFVRIRDASTHASLSPQNDNATKQLPCLHDNGLPDTVDSYIKEHQRILEEKKTKAKEQHEKRAAKKQQKKRQKSKPLVASDDEDIESSPDDIGEQTLEKGWGAVLQERLLLLQQAPDDTGQETPEEEQGAVAKTCSPLLQPKPQVEQSIKQKGNTGGRMRSDTASSSSQSRSRSGTPSRRNQDSPPPEKPRPKFPEDQEKLKTPKFNEETLLELKKLLKNYEVAPGCSKRKLRQEAGNWACGCGNKECPRDRIILTPKQSGDRIEIRQRPERKYREDTELCTGLSGTTCMYIFKQGCCWAPHSIEEQRFWREDIQNEKQRRNYRLKDMIEDVQKTTVVLQAYVARAIEKHGGSFKTICSSCMKEDLPVTTFKKKHVHVCDKEEDEHVWSDTSCGLVFRDGEDIIQLNNWPKEGNDHDILYQTMDILKTMGYTHQDIADESKKVTQRIRAFQNKEPVQITGENYFANIWEGTELLDKAFLEKLQLISNEDMLERLQSQHRNLDESGGSSDKYYKDYSQDKIISLLNNDKDNKYKLCIIHLEASIKAVCNPVDHDDNDARIDIHGRMNCGTAMDGDVVLVEVFESKILDDETTVTRGKVLGVYERKTDREMYTFICTVDWYHTWLMKPICGRAPKIHVVKDVLTQQYGREGANGYIAVHDDDLHVKRILKVNPTTRENFLFVVRYLKWTPDRIYPLGFVVDVIPAGHTVRQTQLVLDLVYQVPPKMHEGINLSKPVKLSGREDFTRLRTVSIDPPGCKDVDDALSLEKLDDEIEGQHAYHVYVHIADVCENLEKGGFFDKQAEERCFTYYPAYGLKNHNMLPIALSENACSLLKSKERYAISLKMKMLQNGKILETLIYKSVISNDIQMTYEEAQQKIRAEEKDDLSEMLAALFQLSCARKKTRVGAPDGVFYTENDINVMETNDAHILVEEMMILANNKVAEFLHEKCPGIVPMRKQDEPNWADMDEFVHVYWHIIEHSKYFSIFKNWLKICRHNKKVKEIPSGVRLLVSTVKSLKAYVQMGDEKALKLLLTQEKLHPMHATTMLQWFMYQWKSEYTCSEDGHAHFSLQLAHYTHFTSPIRRYVDIMVHRVLKAVLDGKSCPYEVDEMEMKICAINVKAIEAKKYDKANRILKLLDLKQKAPAFMPAVVTDVTEKGFSIGFAEFGSKIRSCSEILYSRLKVAAKPDVPESESKTTLTWKKRIYDTTINLSHARNFVPKDAQKIQLNPDKYIAKISQQTWDTVMENVGRNKHTALKFAENLINEAEVSISNAQGVEEVTSEMKSDCDFYRHHVDFTFDVGKGSVVMLQIGAKCTRGQLQPLMTLMRLTPQNDICLHHNAQAIECFTDLASKKVQVAYRDIDDYKDIWLPILSMESVTTAVNDSDPIVIHNVPLRLKKENGGLYGQFKLLQSFCKKRHLGFVMTTKKLQEGMKDVLSTDEDVLVKNLLCIRYKYIVDGKLKVWCGHAIALASKVEEDKLGNENMVVTFHIKSKLLPPPDELLQKDTNCTIESLPISLPNSRMEVAVSNLEKASDLTQAITLRRTITSLFTDLKTTSHLPHKFDINGTNNDSQNAAIRAALRQNFTLIQGPPGTGKTLTAVKLVYWLVEMNRRRQQEGEGHRQVLICGPSNSAVDVVMNLLKVHLGKFCPRIVRVYSETLEQQVFPIPRDQISETSTRGRAYRLVDKSEHKEIALHQLIRNKSNSFSSKITKFDDKFRKCLNKPQEVSDKEIEEYKKLVTDAAVEELPKYDVVLSTCAGSVSPRMQRGCAVEQVIIDECGMCMEPEALIPLVEFTPEQVVLVGDHQQLRPIIIDKTAAELGAATSLFERYKDHAMMLDTQYRMHPHICEFPSTEFYEGKLKTGPSKDWQGPKLPIWPTDQYPFVFMNVEGREVMYSVSTEEGNLGSYYNEAERDLAKGIYLQLTKDCNIPEKCVTVLSQYKAQVTEVKKSLGKVGVQNPNVMSVVSSQGGEWDYVILSLVRSLPEDELDPRPSPSWLRKNMGFITDHNQINVAITRAKKGLIILGNAKLLRKDDMWRHLLEHYSSRGALRSASDFLNKRWR